MIRINEEQCEAIAERLKTFPVKNDTSLLSYRDFKDKAKLAHYWFFLTAVCHKTGDLKGMIRGKRLRGWDLLENRAKTLLKKDPEFFSSEKLRFISSGELEKSLLKGDDRREERALLLRDCALKLLQRYKGDIMNLYRIAKGSLSGEKGILSLLSEFLAYQDPLHKKSFLLIITLYRLGIWDIQDPWAVKLPVDNHLMRIGLRSGMVEIEDIHLREELLKQGCIDPLLEGRIRSSLQGCGDILREHSLMDMGQLDSLLWQIGRNCCLGLPSCHENSCTKEGECSLRDVFTFDCFGSCPLDGICKASRDPFYMGLIEPKSHSHYY